MQLWVMVFLQVRLGGCAELSLKVIEDFKSLIGSLPERLDFALTPYPQHSFPALTRCEDRSLAEDALSRLTVHAFFLLFNMCLKEEIILQAHRSKLSSVYANCVKLERKISKTSLPYVPL